MVAQIVRATSSVRPGVKILVISLSILSILQFLDDTVFKEYNSELSCVALADYPNVIYRAQIPTLYPSELEVDNKRYRNGYSARLKLRQG